MLLSTSSKIAFTIAGVLGFVFCMFGGVLFTFYPRIIQKKIQETMALTETSDSFKSWLDSPVPVYLSFYLFNVTNPVEANDFKKPILSELGPFTFRVIRLKENINWRQEKGQLDFVLRKQFVFQRDMSVGDMSEVIYFLNVPYVGVGSYLKAKFSPEIASFVYPDLSDRLREENIQLIEKHTVKEIIFEGYYVKLLDFLTEYAAGFGMTVPQVLPNNTFGLFYGKNNSVEGDFMIGTGTKDARDINRIFEFDNMTKLPWWGSNYCNMINGTDGSSFSPNLKVTDRLYAFSADLCRSLHLDFDKKTVVEGIPTYRYAATESLFGDPRVYKENACYCDSPAECFKAGVISMASCRGGSPIAVSAPHFLAGDKEYLQAFGGLTPDKDKHETFVDVEPKTGLVMQASRRVQLNINVKHQEGLYIFDNLTADIVFPLAWIHEGAVIDPENANKFKAMVIAPMVMGEAIILGAIVVGAISLVTSLSTAIYFISKSSSRYDPRNQKSPSLGRIPAWDSSRFQ